MSNPTDHKILHNITTLANIPLALWFIYTVFSLRAASQFDFQNWFMQPFNLVAGVLFVIVVLKHFVLEIEVVFQDYISKPCVRNACIYALKIFAFVLGVTATISLLKLGL